MVDHSVGAQDESHASEASQALMFCFDNASPEKSLLASMTSLAFMQLLTPDDSWVPTEQSAIFAFGVAC